MLICLNWGTRDNKCTFCNQDKEHEVHVFIKCHEVEPIWQVLKNLSTYNDIPTTWGTIEILFSKIREDKRHVMNLLCTMVKQYIYRSRCLKRSSSAYQFVKELISLHHVEYTIAKREGKLGKHIKFWSPIIEFYRRGVVLHGRNIDNLIFKITLLIAHKTQIHVQEL